MRKIVTKNYGGIVSIRDYDLQKCLDGKEDLTIVHNGIEMTIKYEDIYHKIKGQSDWQKSKFGKPYRLIDFDWCPCSVQQSMDYALKTYGDVIKKLGEE